MVPHTLLYDAGSLTETLSLFWQVPPTKRYHFVFGDGHTEKKAVKIRSLCRRRPDDPGHQYLKGQ